MVRFGKAGGIGIVTTVAGVVLLGFTFVMAYGVFDKYRNFVVGGDIVGTMNTLLIAAVQAMFLGVMGWVGSILLVRGVDFFKVEKGVGVVTFRVEKGAGVVTGLESAPTTSPDEAEKKS